jgi:hypothetical protein
MERSDLNINNFVFEVVTVVVMNVAIFWDIVLCSSYVNRRFGGKYHIFGVSHIPEDGNIRL